MLSLLEAFLPTRRSLRLSRTCSYPDKSFSITIFCSPAEMLLPALGVDAVWSAVTETCTHAGLLSAVLTSLRIRGRGPSFVAIAWRGTGRGVFAAAFPCKGKPGPSAVHPHPCVGLGLPWDEGAGCLEEARAPLCVLNSTEQAHGGSKCSPGALDLCSKSCHEEAHPGPSKGSLLPEAIARPSAQSRGLDGCGFQTLIPALISPQCKGFA